MCGIVGFTHHNDIKLHADQVVSCLGHRGPDGAGVETIHLDNFSLTFGHTRLAIVELTDLGKQPMFSRDGRWLVTFNGEIYNHNELRKELHSQFEGESDTETLVSCLSEWGINKTLQKLNGIFAFAAYDRSANALYLVRDEFGVKPLYYQASKSNIAFASEIVGLNMLEKVRFGINLEALHTFLSLRYVPSPSTLFSHVKRVPPGHYVRVDLKENSACLNPFVIPNKQRFAGSFSEAKEQYEKLFKGAVRRQLMSDVPIGVLLSGGVDSAAVAAAAREQSCDLIAFTVGFGDRFKECEIRSAQQTAAVLGIPNESVLIDEESAWSALLAASKSVEEPLGTTSIIPMWHLSKLASEHVKVVLTGQGSDEPLGGYNRYKGMLISEYLPHGEIWRLFLKMAERIGVRSKEFERFAFCMSEKSIPQQIMAASALFNKSEVEKLFGRKLSNEIPEALEFWVEWLTGSNAMKISELMPMLDTRMNLSDDLLLYGDKISMAHGLESRVPMLDRDLIRFVESLPRRFKYNIIKSKIVHKKFAENYLPKSIINRKKLGFQIPLDKWILGPWRRDVEGLLLDRSRLHEVISKNAVQKLYTDFTRGHNRDQRQIFSLIFLSLWMQNHG